MEIEGNGCDDSFSDEKFTLAFTQEEDSHDSTHIEIKKSKSAKKMDDSIKIKKNDIEDDIRAICGGESDENICKDDKEDNLLKSKNSLKPNAGKSKEVSLVKSKKSEPNSGKSKSKVDKISTPIRKRTNSELYRDDDDEESQDLFGFSDGKFVFGKRIKIQNIEEVTEIKVKEPAVKVELKEKKIEEQLVENGDFEMQIASHVMANTPSEKVEINFMPASSSVVPIVPPPPPPPTPSPAHKLRPSEDPIFKKPFEMGWKREIVLRATSGSKDKGEVYYITPNGKKLRTRHEIQLHLTPGLTLDSFTFSREPLGAAPTDEIIRNAKPTGRISDSASSARVSENLNTSSSSSSTPGKRIPKPKLPKGASPPPPGWSSTHAVKSHSYSSSRSHSRHSDDSHRSSSKDANSSSKSSSSKKGEPCTIQCVLAMGMIPQLQCVKCLCLYHHECVGLDRSDDDFRLIINDSSDKNFTGKKNYECDSCKAQTKTKSEVVPEKNIVNSKIPTSQATTSVSDKTTKSQSRSSISNPNSQQSTSLVEAKKSDVIENTSKNSQTIAVLNGRKYLVIHKPGYSPPDEHHEGSSSKHSSSSAKVPVVCDTFVQNLFGNVSSAYDVILEVFKYLKVQELLRAACVSRLWNHLANEHSLWKIVRMKNSTVKDWSGFAATLSRNGTQHLDLKKMICPKSSVERMWTNFGENIQKVSTLKIIDLGRCPASVVENLFITAPQLNILNATSIKSENLNLENLDNLKNLTELRLKATECCNLLGDLTPFAFLKNLRHLSLTSINDIDFKNIQVLGKLIQLESLEIGGCSSLDETFATDVLVNLNKLKKLRLEKSTETQITYIILEQISKMNELIQLELVNFDIRDGFEQKLLLCKNLKRLLLIPTYVSQSATTNQIILRSIRELITLEAFTWVVTLELLSVTTLYSDQQWGISESRNNCIPVLKPVPGTVYEKNEQNLDKEGIPLIKVISLQEIKDLLEDGSPNTKHKIVKVPYCSTWRQNFSD